MKPLVITTCFLWAAIVHAAPTLDFPLDRRNYFVGETILLAVDGVTLPAQMALVDEAGKVVAATQITSNVLRLETALLRPGRYTVTINQEKLSPAIEVTATARHSIGAL